MSALFGESEEIKVNKIFRLGKKSTQNGDGETKPRLMLVSLKNKDDVDALMSRRWELKKVGFSNIYLTRDISPEEREVQKKLREEWTKKGRENFRIFRGKVIPKRKED